MPLNHPDYAGVRAAVKRDMHPTLVQHPDTVAVNRFAEEMATKMAQARAKGRAGWETCPPDVLSRMLREHVEKGDPRDIANFCMMLWHLGQPIAAAPAAQAVEPAAVATLWVEESGVIDFEVLPPCNLPPGEYSLYTQRAAPAPAAVAVPGGWQPISAAPKSGRTLILGFFNESGKWRTTRGQWFTQEHIDDTWEDADDCKAGWYETPVVGDDCYPVAPTHWMPLPAEPGAAPQAQDVQRDAERLDHLIKTKAQICHDETCADGYWLEFDKEDGSRWVQLGEFDTAREAIDAAIAASAAQGEA